MHAHTLGRSSVAVRAQDRQLRERSSIQVHGPPAAILKLGQFFSLHSVCFLDETLKVVGPFNLVSLSLLSGVSDSLSLLPGVSVPSTWCLCPFYLVSLPVEAKLPAQGGKCLTCCRLTNS